MLRVCQRIAFFIGRPDATPVLTISITSRLLSRQSRPRDGYVIALMLGLSAA